MTTDATYAIDVTSLAHRDDVKKDDFGRWNHKGSYPIPVYIKIKGNGKVCVKQD